MRSKTFIHTACNDIIRHIGDHSFIVQRSMNLGEMPEDRGKRILQAGKDAVGALDRFHILAIHFFRLMEEPDSFPPPRPTRRNVVVPFRRPRKKT